VGRVRATIKKAQSVFGGGAVIVCAFVLMWGGASNEVQTSNSLGLLAEQAIDIDPMTPHPSDNGRLVVAAAALSSSESYEDEYLKPAPHLLLRRRVEMYQWMETERPAAPESNYSTSWAEGQIDFFSFKVPAGHENPLLLVAPRNFTVSQATFGAFDAARILPLIQKLDRLALTPDLLKDPQLQIEDNKIIVRRNPGSIGDALGDMRVWYETLPQGDYTVMTVQEDERSLIGASPSSTLFIQKGRLSTTDFVKGEEKESDKSFKGMLYMGGSLLFFGCISLLAPHAKNIDLNPRLNVRGMMAVVIISGAISCVAMVLFFLLSLTS